MADWCPIGSVCDKGGGATDPDWYQTGIEASLAEARAQMERGEITSTQYYQFELNTLGREGIWTNTQMCTVVGGILPAYQENTVYRLGAEANGLKERLRQFPGSEATYMRWLIKDRMVGLQRRADRLRREVKDGVQVAPRAPSGVSSIPEPPIPAWMEEYLERSAPAAVPEYSAGQLARPSSRGAPPTPEGAAALRPMGAQAELTPEQMGLMAGYQAWGAAGSPRRYSEEALIEMSDWQKSWDPYTRLSESLFPKQAKLRGDWRTALQR